MIQFPMLPLDILPETSLFRSGEPFNQIAIPFLASIPETMVTLHLAWRSIGLRIPIQHSLGTSVIVGISSCLIRQLVPLPFHLLANLALLAICTVIKTHVSIMHAVLGGMFTISVTIMGSSLTIEPLVILLKNFDFLKGSLGFTLGSLVETIIPLIVLVFFIKFDITLLPRSRDAANNHEKES